jgi:hypothetical protein
MRSLDDFFGGFLSILTTLLFFFNSKVGDFGLTIDGFGDGLGDGCSSSVNRGASMLLSCLLAFRERACCYLSSF